MQGREEYGADSSKVYNLRKTTRKNYKTMSGRGRSSDDQVILKVNKKGESELVSSEISGSDQESGSHVLSES